MGASTKHKSAQKLNAFISVIIPGAQHWLVVEHPGA